MKISLLWITGKILTLALIVGVYFEAGIITAFTVFLIAITLELQARLNRMQATINKSLSTGLKAMIASSSGVKK